METRDPSNVQETKQFSNDLQSLSEVYGADDRLVGHAFHGTFHKGFRIIAISLGCHTDIETEQKKD